VRLAGRIPSKRACLLWNSSTDGGGGYHWLGAQRTAAPGRLTVAILGFDAVRTLGLSLPDVVEGTAYGFPALKLRGKLLACIPANKSAEVNSIVVRIDLEHRAELLREYPQTYYITDHYAPHPTVLVRLSKISRTNLQQLLRDACRCVSASPKRRTGRKHLRGV
jgi:hypothetical protein